MDLDIQNDRLKILTFEIRGERNGVWECSCKGKAFYRNYMSKNDKKFDFKSEITYLTVVILSWRSVIKFF